MRLRLAIASKAWACAWIVFTTLNYFSTCYQTVAGHATSLSYKLKLYKLKNSLIQVYPLPVIIMPEPGLQSDSSTNVSQVCVCTPCSPLACRAVFLYPLGLNESRSNTFLFSLGLIVSGSFIFSINHPLGWAWSPCWSYQLLYQQLSSPPCSALSPVSGITLI